MTKFKDLSKSKQTMLLVVIFIAALIAVFALIFVAILLAVNLSGNIKICEGTYAYQGESKKVTENLTIDYLEITFVKTDEKNLDEKNDLNVYYDRDSDTYYVMTFKMRINGESQYKFIPLKFVRRIPSKSAYRYKYENFEVYDYSIQATLWLTNKDRKNFAKSIDLHFYLLDADNKAYESVSLKLEFISK